MQGVCVKFPYAKNPDIQLALGPSFFLTEPSYAVAVLNWIWIYLHRNTSDDQKRVFVDIGMNAGFFTAFASALGAEVFSFEPQTACMNLGFNSVLLQKSELHTHFYNVGITSISSSFTTQGGKCDPGNVAIKGSGESRVQTINLASVWPPACSPEIDMIKIDTEGSEISVIQGLFSFFEARKVRAAVIEITEPATRPQGGWTLFGASPEKGVAIFNKIESFGYELIYLWCEVYKPGHNRINSLNLKIPGVQCQGAANELEHVKAKDLLVHLRASTGGNYLLRRV